MTAIPHSGLRTQDSGLHFEFDGVVRLTRIGVSFVIFTVFIGFAAINTGNNSLYIGLSLMLGALILSGVASKGGLKQLHVEFGRVDEAWAGRDAHGTLRITNRSRLWNVRDLVVTSPELARPLFVPLIERRQTVSADAPFLFHHRGLVRLKLVDLYTRYPFGFFLKKRRVKMEGEVIVYPRLLPEDAVHERFAPAEGELHSSNRVGPGTEIHSFREYVLGDSLRHVYWKKSAALGRWIMKQTETEAGRVVHVAIDPYKPRAASDDDFEQMVSEATTFVDALVRRDLEVLVSLPRIDLRARGGESASTIFRALALLEPSHEVVSQTLDRGTVLFAVRRDDERKSA